MLVTVKSSPMKTFFRKAEGLFLSPKIKPSEGVGIKQKKEKSSHKEEVDDQIENEKRSKSPKPKPEFVAPK